jgi:hypothetical protein
MDDFLRAIVAKHRVFLYREAIEAGYNDKTLRALVRAGEWHKVRHGSFTFADVWATADAAERHRIFARAVLRTAKTPAVLSHTSSIVEQTDTFWDLDLSEAHISRKDGRTGRRAAGVRQHQGRLIEGDIVKVNGVEVTSATRAALEVSTVTDTERSLVVVNGLLHEKKTTMEALVQRYEASIERWPMTLKTDLVLRLADGRIESVGETRIFHLFWRQGVPRPEPQYDIYDEHGTWIARVDFAWPDCKVFVEFDGKSKYQKLLKPGEDPGEVVFREKKREDLIRRVTGWTCIRLTWADLYAPEATAARVLRELGQQAV